MGDPGTVEYFLANLVTVRLAGGTTCQLCARPNQDAGALECESDKEYVQLVCGHICCRKCVTRQALTRGRTSCPTCDGKTEVVRVAPSAKGSDDQPAKTGRFSSVVTLARRVALMRDRSREVNPARDQPKEFKRRRVKPEPPDPRGPNYRHLPTLRALEGRWWTADLD